MIRLRSFAASARQVRVRSSAATPRQGGLRGFVASAGRARLWWATALFVVIAGDSRILACPMCFGAEETAMIDGTRLGIVVMLGITLAVQGAFVAFFLYLRKCAKRAAEIELDTEWSELQRAPRI